MAKFETGAVRSSDIDNQSWYLISPIGWKRLAKVYSKVSSRHIRTDLYKSQAIDFIRFYLSGDRGQDYLAYALFNLFEIMHLEETTKNTSVGLQMLLQERFDLISHVGMRRLAETYKEGEIKYGAYNVEKGMPIHDL